MSDSVNQYAVLPSNPVDRKAILDGLEEISNAFTRIAAERDYIKESVAALSEKFEVKKPVLNKLARFYHKNDAKEVKAKMEEIFAALETLTGEDLDQ